MSTININIQVLELFVKADKLSAARLYFYVKQRFNNHVHASCLELIKKDLQISSQVLQKNIKQLTDLGICIKHSTGYWRFNSWKKFAASDKNRVINIPLAHLQNLKNLRTIHYAVKYRSSYRWSRKHNKPTHTKRQMSSGFYPVSASLVKAVTSEEVTENTLLTHLKRAAELGLCEIKKQFNNLGFSTSLRKLRLMQKSLDINNLVIVKHSLGFQLLEILPNLVRWLG